jgi:hypothetical protein
MSETANHTLFRPAVALEDGEAQIVARLRARRVPWAHIARQVGRNELSLRKAYGQEFDPCAALPFGAAHAGRRPKLLLPILARVANNTAAQIARTTPLPTRKVCAVLNRARLNGWARHDGGSPRCWTLTRAGRAKLEGEGGFL